jgi:ATP-dependent exoDNAse (exonuclease V) alpha subunit
MSLVLSKDKKPVLYQQETVKILENTESLSERERIVETVLKIAAKKGLIPDTNHINTAINANLYSFITERNGIKKEYIVSKQMMQMEQQNLQIIKSTRDIYEPVFSEQKINKIIEKFENKNKFLLSRGQKEAVYMALKSSDAYMAWQGVAGAGKTTSIQIVADAFRGQNYQVIGMAPTGKAAEELAKNIGSGQTIHSFLSKNQDYSEKTLMIVDESSMIDTKLAAQFLQKIEEQRAAGKEVRVIFVGDVNQLQAVQAGRFFADIQKSIKKEITISTFQNINITQK